MVISSSSSSPPSTTTRIPSHRLPYFRNSILLFPPFVVVVLVLLLLPSFATALLIVPPGVGTGGSGACVPTGTDIRTCPDIQSALTITALEPYEIIQLEGGIYSGNGNINLVLTTTNVTLRGSSNPLNRSVIVLNINNPTPNTRWLTYTTNNINPSYIQDIDITNGYMVNGTGAGILYAPTTTVASLTLNRVNFINCTSNGTGLTFINLVTPVPNGNGGALTSIGNGLTILNSQFINNNANNNGGALYHGVNDKTILLNCSFLFNTVGSFNAIVPNSNTNGGGAIIVTNNANVTYTNVQFMGNTVYNGIGGGAVLVTGTSSIVTLNTNFFMNNQVTLPPNLPPNIAATLARGGALLTLDTSSLLIQNNCQFVNNYAGSSGGALEVSDASTVTILSSSFTGNSAGNRGGTARFTTLNNVYLVNSTLANSYASQQGGFLQLEGPGNDASVSVYTVQGTSFYNGSSLIAGGCIWTMRDLTLRIQYSSFSTCVSYAGGAIYAAQFTGPEVDGFLGITQNTVISYSSATNGAAVYVENGAIFHISDSRITLNSGINGILTAWSGSTLLVTNSVVQNNNAIDGAGIYVTLNSYAYVSRTSFFSNSATNRGGVAYITSDITFELCDSIGNSAGYGGVFSISDNNGALCRNFQYINGSITGNTATSAGGVFWVDQITRPCTTNIVISPGTVINGNAARYYGNIRASRPSQFSLLSPNSSSLLPLRTAPSVPVSVSVGLVDAYQQAVSPPNIGATLVPYFVRNDGGLGSFAVANAAVQYSNDINATTVISNILIYGFPDATITIGFRLNPSDSGSSTSNNLPVPLTVPILLTNCPLGTQLINADKGTQFNYCGKCDDNFYNLDMGGLCKPCPSVGVSCIQGEIQVQRGYYAAAVSNPSVSSSFYADTSMSSTVGKVSSTDDAEIAVDTALPVLISSSFDAEHILDGTGAIEGSVYNTTVTTDTFPPSSPLHDSPYPRPLSPAITLLDVSPCRYNGCCNQPLCPFSNQCPAGRTGFQCSDCTPGYISIGGDCILSSACTSTNSGLLALAYFFATVLTVLIIYTARFRSTDTLFSSLLFLYQVTYFLTEDADPWLRHITGTVSLNIRELYYLLWNNTNSCIGPWDDLTLLSIPYVIPGFMYVMLGGVWLLHTLYRYCRRRTSSSSDTHGTDGTYTLALHRITVGVAAVLINTSIQLVSCGSYLTLNANGSKGTALRLLAAPSVQCYTGNHLPLGIIAWIILTAVCIVWPLTLYIGVPKLVGKNNQNIPNLFAIDNNNIHSNSPPSSSTNTRSILTYLAWIIPYQNTMRPWAAGFFTVRRLVILIVAASLQFSAAAVSTALIFAVVVMWGITVRFAPFETDPKVTEKYPLVNTGRTIDSWTLGALVMMSHLASARIATINDPLYSDWGNFQNILFIILLVWLTFVILLISVVTVVPRIGYILRHYVDKCTGGRCCGRPAPAWLTNIGKELDDKMDSLSLAYMEAMQVTGIEPSSSSSSASSGYNSKNNQRTSTSSASFATPLFASTVSTGSSQSITIPGWAGTDKVHSIGGTSSSTNNDSTISSPPVTPTIALQNVQSSTSSSSSGMSTTVKINPLAALNNTTNSTKNNRTSIPPLPVETRSSPGNSSPGSSSSSNPEDEHTETGTVPGSTTDDNSNGNMSEREKAVRKMMG